MAEARVAQQSLAPGESTVVQVQGQKIALCRVDDAFYAIDNVCIHSGGPLGEGSLHGCIVTCPWHGWEFDVTTGVCELDGESRVQTYPVRLDGDDVVIEVADA